MSISFRVFLLILVINAQFALAQVATYDPASGVLSIPSVKVGNETYIKLRLKDSGGLVFVLQAATLEFPAATPPFARYDIATAQLAIPVVNSGGVNYENVTLKNIGNYTFTVVDALAVAAPPRIEAPPRWLDAWTSTNADARTGLYTLSVIDPLVSAALLPVDNAIPVADFALGSARLYGGTYDPATRQVIDPGVRFIGFNRGGRLYGVTLDHTTNAVPVPAQMTSETAARSAPILAAQSASGDDAVFKYSVFPGNRYMRLSAVASTAPLMSPVFPGDKATLSLVGSEINSDTGALTGLLWSSLTSNDLNRLFLTGPDFNNPVSIAVYTGPISNVTGDSHARMAGGWVFTADGALRRYDFKTRAVSVILANVNLFGTATYDDDSLLIRTLQPGVPAPIPALMRCVDAATATCVTLLTGASVGTASDSFLYQTSTHVLITPVVGTAITSVRKADGVVTKLDIPTGGFARLWSLGNGQAAGERVFYWRNTGTANLVGSVNGDGGDRKEFAGTPISSAWTLPYRVSAHRLGYLEQLSPYDKLMIRAGVAGNPNTNQVDRLAWLDGNTGDLSADLGTVPSKFFNTFSKFPSPPPPYPLMHGNLSTVGLLSEVSVQFQPVVKQLDTFIIRVQPPGILRASNIVP